MRQNNNALSRNQIWIDLHAPSFSWDIFKTFLCITLEKGGILYLRWKYFGLYWPPTYPGLTFVEEDAYYYKGQSAYYWHFQYHLPTSSCRHCLWTPKNYNIQKYFVKTQFHKNRILFRKLCQPIVCCDCRRKNWGLFFSFPRPRSQWHFEYIRRPPN